MGPGPLNQGECCQITLTVCGDMTVQEVDKFNKELGKLLNDKHTSKKSVVRGVQPPPSK